MSYDLTYWIYKPDVPRDDKATFAAINASEEYEVLTRWAARRPMSDFLPKAQPLTEPNLKNLGRLEVLHVESLKSKIAEAMPENWKLMDNDGPGVTTWQSKSKSGVAQICWKAQHITVLMNGEFAAGHAAIHQALEGLGFTCYDPQQ